MIDRIYEYGNDELIRYIRTRMSYHQMLSMLAFYTAKLQEAIALIRCRKENPLLINDIESISTAIMENALDHIRAFEMLLKNEPDSHSVDDYQDREIHSIFVALYRKLKDGYDEW